MFPKISHDLSTRLPMLSRRTKQSGAQSKKAKLEIAANSNGCNCTSAHNSNTLHRSNHNLIPFIAAMKLFSIIPLFSLAAVAPVDAIFGSDRHPTKAERREARTRYAAENGRRRLVMEDCPGVTPPYLEYFKELSDDEKLAAVVLGYSWAMWDADDSPSQYSGKAWEDLTNRTQFPVELADDVYFLQKNFQELGIDKNVYNGYFSYAFWGKLEKIAPGLNAAASTLGFNKETWNTCYHTICTPVQASK